MRIIKITKIPNNEPPAVPELWNSRYREIDANFEELAKGISSISETAATEKVAGIARIATAEEAEAWEDDSTIITPAKLA
ncbi:MAG: hypothetical protein NC211_03485, partial [Alistipes senegalensis]|nr:hypothetical protein [Oxalobacter formigenes]MCM1280880.1 hypothetical protein [Alistipes senegalensis]